MGPIKTPLGYYVFVVEKTTPKAVQPLSSVKSQITSQLTQQAQQEVFTQFVSDYTSKWQSRTFCASGYEIERCSNYVSSGHPASAPPACYEAHPKGGLPAACPAAVQQLRPPDPRQRDDPRATGPAAAAATPASGSETDRPPPRAERAHIGGGGRGRSRGSRRLLRGSDDGALTNPAQPE